MRRNQDGVKYFVYSTVCFKIAKFKHLVQLSLNPMYCMGVQLSRNQTKT